MMDKKGEMVRKFVLEHGVMPQSWKPEVIADSSDKWFGNALRFATMKEAEEQVHDLEMRWFSVRNTRVVPSSDPVNYQYINHELVRVKEEA